MPVHSRSLSATEVVTNPIIVVRMLINGTPNATASRATAPIASNSQSSLPSSHRIMPRRARRGGGITDLLLAAVIAIIILAGIFAFFQSVNRSIKDSRLNSMITRAASVIERSYSNAITYPNASLLPSLAVSGVFSDGEIAQVGTDYNFVSPYSTDITVQGSGARTYTITINDIPDHACSNLLTTFTDGSTTLQGLSVNGTALTAPYSTAAADAACDNEINDVALTF